MRRLLIVIATALSLVSCGGGFTSAEREIIYAGEGDIMRVLSIDNEADSLFLRESSLPLSEEMLRTKEYALLRERMLCTVKNPEAEGVGIAAPQVGVLRRLAVVDVEEGYFELINPVILQAKGEQTGWEGCLSVRGKSGVVTRPMKVKIIYFDRNGEKHFLQAKGFFARAICHELDHLDGVLYIDKASHLQKD